MEIWLKSFIKEIQAENEILRSAGALEHAEARTRLLNRLEVAANEFGSQTVSVEEASKLTGWDEETIRRRVRAGELTDLRDNPKGHIRILRHELDRLGIRQVSGGTSAYDPAADARRLAQKRGRVTG